MILELAVIKATLLLASGALLVRFLRGGAASARAAVCVLALGGSILVAALSLWPVAPGLAVDLPVTRFLIRAVTPARGLPGPGTAPLSIVPAIWLAGAAILAFRYAFGISIVRRIVASSTPLPLDSAWRQVAGQMAPGVEIRTADVATPVACRLLSPVILVPAEMADWPQFRCRPVVLHEIAHIRRHDLAANAIATLATVLFWFHPLAWMLAARLHREQELACDDAVLNQGVIAHSYAGLLLESASAAPGGPLLGCAMAGKSAAFKTRIAHVLDTTRPRRSSRRTTVGMSVTFLAVTLLTGSCRPPGDRAADQVYKAGPDVAAPKLLHKVEPEYTPAARAAKIQGVVVLRVVIGPDGLAHDVTVIKTIDAGLSEKAVEAIKQWRFEPGRRKGEPVKVQAQIEVNFRLL